MKENYAVKNIFILSRRRETYIEFFDGFKKGIPIALGYIPVSFTFGLMAVNGGLPPWLAILISLSNFTSAGQFAGSSLILQNASLVEISLTTFVINIRYMLMSLSLSQKIKENTSILLRGIVASGITDETFTIASMEKEKVTFAYMFGLILGPYVGWVLGTVLGAVSSGFLPEALQDAMGIALYAMFIALIVPAAKKTKEAALVVVIAVLISSLFTWMPLLSHVSDGWKIMIATIAASSMGAIWFPREGEEV